MSSQYSISNKKRIAKNTLFLYIRMMLIMAISLYTSRIILNALGIVDYGVYNVVGGMVVMFGFLNSALAQASQRYIAYGIEKDSVNMQIKTFSMLFNVHIIIAIVILALSETIGLWLFYNKLVIPEERMASAFWVMQFSIISLLVSVTQVPYNASIFAHEKMNAYAYISIVEVFLKLGVVIVIKYCFEDKLIAYGALTMGASLVIALLYRLYCVRKFSNCHYIRYWSPKLFKELFSYTSWSLIGNLAWTFNSQGMNILINMFFGPVFNAARGIASSVEAALSSFLYNFTTPSVPPIIKAYAVGDIKGMIYLNFRSSKLGFLLFMCLSLPLISVVDNILSIWLITPPPQSNIFCILSLIYIQCNAMSGTLQNVVQATGKVKTYQISNGLLKLLALPIVYVIYKCGGDVVTYLWVLIVFSIVGLFVQLEVVNRLISEFHISEFLGSVIFPALGAYILPLLLSLYFWQKDWEFIQAIGIVVLMILICSLSVWYIGFTLHERNWIVDIVKSKIKNK